MNEHSLNDPQLKSLEARLAATAPQLSPAEQQQLLYECAFAAGRQANRKTLRRWQAAAAGLGAVVLALALSRAHDGPRVADRNPRPFVPVEVRLPFWHAGELPEIPRQSAVELELDAWQVEPAHDASLAEQLAQFERTDPELRSLAVGRWTHALLQP